MIGDPQLILSLRLFLALILLASALHKLRDLPTFAGAFAEYRLLPRDLALAVAPGIAGIELALVAALVSPWAGLAALATAGLFCVYSLGIGINLLRGRREISCGCGGFGSAQPIHGGLLLRNGLLVLAAFAATSQTPAGLPESAPWLAAAVAPALALVYGASDQLLANSVAGVR